MGGTLYVVGSNNGTVGTYDATTGAALNPSFITGLNSPWGLAFAGDSLFVSNNGSGTVARYNATTGAPINLSFVTGLNRPTGLAYWRNDYYGLDEILVSNRSTNPFFPIDQIGDYNIANGFGSANSIGHGLDGPGGLAVRGNDFYVADEFHGLVHGFTSHGDIDSERLASPRMVAFNVPEPGSVCLALLGGVSLLARRRHQN